ncbi:MAG TPA: histidine kinase dimerization/phospho-acceptor domain-containing protein, partial [Chthonomonadaceae bacterium]|nr:histidine kinase dimerization/phospho-acceptor domain-containing protein [Chthonomonadaceae bacterium]
MPILNSIRARLTAASMLVSGAAVIATCSVACAHSYAAASASVDRLLSRTRDAVLSGAGGPAPASTAADWLRANGAQLDAERIGAAVVDGSGAIVARTAGAPPGWQAFDSGWRTVRVAADGQSVIVGYDWRHAEGEVFGQARSLGLFGLLLVAITGAVSWALVGQTLLPIRMLSRQARAATTDDLRLSLVAPTQDDEVAELVSTLNGMLERLAATVTQRGRFYAAASHELRTPLQALSGHLELALNRERSATEYRAMLEEARLQAERLTVLTRDVLFLNRLDVGSAPAPQPVELSELCERLFTHYQGLAARR